MTQPAKHTPQWYAANMGNDHQGLIVDEQTGRNVAVAYDKSDVHMLAAAPAMYEAIRKVIEHRAKEYLDNTVEPYCSLVAALAQAEARS